MKRNDWYNAYVTLVEKQGDKNKISNIKMMVASVWNLFAESVHQGVFDQDDEDDEEPSELFFIEMLGKTAARHYADGHWEPLFMEDIYDYLIVGMAQEVLESWTICDDILNGDYLGERLGD